MAKSKEVTACLLIIGNEVLSGRTHDANLPYLGENLNKIGIRLAEARALPDVEAEICGAVDQCRRKFDYVFTTGGIGPTHDDITTACIAKVFGVPVVRNQEAVRRLTEYMKAKNLDPNDRALNEARLKMADIPEGATLIDNPVSAAPGFNIENVFVMAGVPPIMRGMFEGFKGRLKGGAVMRSHSMTAPVPEGRVAGPLTELQKRHPDVEIGSYPFKRENQFGATLVIRGTDPDEIAAAAEEMRRMIRELGVEPVNETTDDPTAG